MSSELKNIISPVQQLDNQEQNQLLDHLVSQTEPHNKSDNPWLVIAGNLVDDPFFDEYIAAIQQYRKELDLSRLPQNHDYKNRLNRSAKGYESWTSGQ
jgi:hypothetical protein